MGGTNLYQYAPNPTGWVDPFGLMKCECPDGSTVEINEHLDTEAKAKKAERKQRHHSKFGEYDKHTEAKSQK